MEAHVVTTTEEILTICPVCKKMMPDVGRRQRNTAYVNEDLNFLTSCQKCHDADEEYWSEQWQEYYSSRF